MIDPPLRIPLSNEQLQAIGETCAILGQIDLFMQETVIWLLNVPVPVAASIMGSTDARARAGVWEEIVRAKCRNMQTKALAKDALKRFSTLSGQRNDFVHAFFGRLVTRTVGNVTTEGIHLDMYPADILVASEGTPVAIKVRTHRHQPAATITQVRDDAAVAAHLFQRIARDTFLQWRDEQHASLGKPGKQRLPRPANPEQS